MVGDHRRHRKLNPRPTLWLLSTKRMGAEAGRLHPAFRPEHGLYQKSARAPFDWLLIHKKTKSLEVIFGYQLQMRRHLRLMFGTCVLCFRLGEKSLCRSFCNHALPFLHFCIRETTERKKNPGLLSAPQRLCPMLPSYGPGLRATPNLRKPPPPLSLTLLPYPSFLSLNKTLPGSSFAVIFRDSRCDFCLYLMLSLSQPLPNTSKVSQHILLAPAWLLT